MAVLAILNDLILQSRIETAAKHAGVTVCIAPGVSALPDPPSGESWHLVILDLNLALDDPSGLLAAVQAAAPGVALIAYCSHLQVELQARAKRAGCATILPRSVFVRRLPDLL